MTERIHSLDTLKGIALLSIVFIHARGAFIGHGPIQNTLDFLLLNISRLAVPIFFLISGYLFRIKIKDRKEFSYTTSYFRKLIKYYLIGTGIFLILNSVVLALNRFLELSIISSIVDMKLLGLNGLFNFLYLGKSVAPHLWFLTALTISIGLVYISQRYNISIEFFVAGLILHLFAIFSITYGAIDLVKPPQHDALFFGLVFTSGGFLVRKYNLPSRSKKFYVKTTAVLGLLHFLERGILSMLANNQPFYWGDHSITTLPLALSVFLLFLSDRELGKTSRINRYGKHTLWAYILHPALLGLFIGLVKIAGDYAGFNIVENLGWSIAATILTYVLIMESVFSQRFKQFSEKISSCIN